MIMQQKKSYKKILIWLQGGLRKWVKEKWVDIGAPKKNGKYQPCGRSKGEQKSNIQSVSHLQKRRSMSAGQKASAVRRKRAASNTGPKPTNVRTYAKKKR